MSRPMPRLIVIRHGETEWTINGRHTGLTDIPLTVNGEAVAKSGATRLVGDNLIIDPKRCRKAFVSPRQRALQTFHLFFDHVEKPPLSVTSDVQEWDYGEYEGLTTSEILQINPTWTIWTDGCPGGESVEQMQSRVDTVIARVRECHLEYLQGSAPGKPDTVIVAHGHFSRVLIARWLDYPLANGRHFNIGTASISVLGYAHRSMREPVIDLLNASL